MRSVFKNWWRLSTRGSVAERDSRNAGDAVEAAGFGSSVLQAGSRPLETATARKEAVSFLTHEAGRVGSHFVRRLGFLTATDTQPGG